MPLKRISWRRRQRDGTVFHSVMSVLQPAARTTESPFFVLPDNIHHGWQTMADDAFALLSCFYVSEHRQVWHCCIRSSTLSRNKGESESHGLYLYLSRKYSVTYHFVTERVSQSDQNADLKQQVQQSCSDELISLINVAETRHLFCFWVSYWYIECD